MISNGCPANKLWKHNSLYKSRILVEIHNVSIKCYMKRANSPHVHVNCVDISGKPVAELVVSDDTLEIDMGDAPPANFTVSPNPSPRPSPPPQGDAPPTPTDTSLPQKKGEHQSSFQFFFHLAICLSPCNLGHEIHETCDSITFYFMKKLIFWY